MVLWWTIYLLVCSHSSYINSCEVISFEVISCDVTSSHHFLWLFWPNQCHLGFQFCCVCKWIPHVVVYFAFLWCSQIGMVKLVRLKPFVIPYRILPSVVPMLPWCTKVQEDTTNQTHQGHKDHSGEQGHRREENRKWNKLSNKQLKQATLIRTKKSN